ncbi:transmembrane protein 231 [Sinocyclocheilus grahami]|uniref:transmembrane protein 231 n=1 Tax=Sinocyclocheilus grahami TaxID=75366 RepID=UPI0007AD4B6E|nr:PREDICTED: transmembrane protein 231 [Sinocyclocheilus grahami]
MAFYEVYTHPALIRHRTRVCTRATLFICVVLCLTYISPLLVAYRSQGFWLKSSTYEEQAVIQFQYDMIVIGATDTAGSYIAWSTFPNFNRLMGDNLRIPAVSVQEEDRNQDGKSDLLTLQINIPLKPEEQMFGIQLLITFSYQLFQMSTVAMQTLAFVQHSSPVPGSQLFVCGDLKLNQRSPLPHRGLHSIYNVSLIDASSPFASTYDLANIIRLYQQRNLSTHLSGVVPVWTVGRAAHSPFQISAQINYPVETITYRPGFWETIKFAWIQYVSVLLIFLWVFQHIQTFIFQNQVLPTTTVLPFKQHSS